MSWPESGFSRPPIMLSRVDLPLPEGPMIETNSPSAIVMSTPSRALIAPASKLLRKYLASIKSLIEQRLRGRETGRPPGRIKTAKETDQDADDHGALESYGRVIGPKEGLHHRISHDVGDDRAADGGADAG